MVEKINLESGNILEENISKLRQIFPNVFSEGKIDFDKLKENLGVFKNTSEDKYTFSWAGRMDSIKNIQTPTHGTLIPQKDESINFDETENIFIEGENLEVLKLLQKTYSNKIKMIYIDPPYNTGNDFIYKDDFKDNLDNYLQQTGQKKEGIKLTSNPETSGRFHSDWISFMYPRLFLARELLKDDGLIFISIGQQELSNIITITNEIFGEENRLGLISRLMKSGSNKGRFFSPNIDYILVFSKNIQMIDEFRLPLEQEYIDKNYTEIQKDGPLKGEKYCVKGLYQASLEIRPNQRYWIQCPDGSFVIPPGKTYPKKINDAEKIKPVTGDGVWRWSYERYLKESHEGNFVFKKTKTSSLVDQNRTKSIWNVYTKIWLKNRLDEGRVPTDLITKFENRHSHAELKKLNIPFDYAKPSELISYLISFINSNNFIMLDFFAGSSSTAHAVLNANNNDGGTRKFICVQIPEKCIDLSQTYKNKFDTITDISKERIRRVIKKINDENKQQKLNSKQNQDLGFKVFKLTKSNYKIWDNVNDETKLKEQLKLFEEPLVENYKDIDVIYEIIIKEGYSLNSEITKISEKPNKIYKVTDDEFFFFVTLDEKLDEKSLDTLNLTKNIMFVCLDSAISDSQKTNLDKLCKLRTI